MLAGNVNVSLNGRGDLTIRGDGQDNNVLVTATLEGDLLIAGVDTQIKLDGVVGPFQVVPTNNAFDFAGNVKLVGGGGNDIIAWDSMDITGRLTATLGGGNDALTISNSEIGDLVRIKGSGGADRIDLFAVTARDDVSLFLNSQSTVAEDLDGISVLSCQFDGDLNLSGSSRDDNVVLEQTIVSGSLKAKLSGSNDVAIFFQTEIVGDTQIDSGSGDDTVDLEQATFGAAAQFKLGSGDDLVNFFTEVTFDSTVIFDGNSGIDALFGVPPNFSTAPIFAGLEVNSFAV